METITLTRKEGKAQVKAIYKTWYKIADVLEKNSHHLKETYFSINLESEKRHLRGKPEGIKNFLTVKEGSIYFCVKWVLEYLVGGSRYSILDVLTCRIEAVQGEAIGIKFENELREALKDVDIREVYSFDYAVLQNIK